jgi:hypothetical protein
MCPSHRFSIARIGVSEPLKTLMNKYIVHQKISQSITKDPNTNRQSIDKNAVLPQEKTTNTHECIKNKKNIISFKPRIVVFVVVVFV